jgi:hypothetical protein
MTDFFVNGKKKSEKEKCCLILGSPIKEGLVIAAVVEE